MTTEKLYYSNRSLPETLQILATADFASVKLQLNQINKKYDPINLVTKQGILNKPTAILRYLAAGTALNGSSPQDKNQLNVWYEYFHTDLLPLLTQLYGQIQGQKPANQTKYAYCLTEVTKNLKILDESLKIKTFFVGNQLTILDITLVCYLQNLFKSVISESERKKYINLFRWFNHVRSIPIFTKHLGQTLLCGKDSIKLSFSKLQEQTQAKTQPKTDVKTEQKTEVKTEQKTEVKTQTKPEGKKKEKKVEAKNQIKTQTAQQNQPQNAEKAGQFKLDDFKKEFQNSQNKKQVLNNLLETLDQEKFSVWKIHYDKKQSEVKVLDLTQNLANGTLQGLEGITKIAFGVWGVYGTEGNYEIRGVMIWEGAQITQAWKSHPAFEHHKFTKLSPKNPEDQRLICDYILQAETAEGLALQSTKRLA